MTALGWQRVIVIALMLAFASFALWLTASRFDTSELKTLLVLSVGFVTREVLPLLMKTLSGTTEALSKGRLE
jgi:hypothetical protein